MVAEPALMGSYLPDTNILLTRFLCETGVAEVSDFMVVEEETHHRSLIRRAKAVRGTITFNCTFEYEDGDTIRMKAATVSDT